MVNNLFVIFCVVFVLDLVFGDVVSEAYKLEREVNAGKVGGEQLAARVDAVAKLLQVNDTDSYFAEALIHAAVLQDIGHKNNGQTINIKYKSYDKLQSPSSPFADQQQFDNGVVFCKVKSPSSPFADMQQWIEYDWIRHLALEGKLFDADKLCGEVSIYVERARRLGNQAVADKITNVLDQMNNTKNDLARCRQLWLETRRLLRPAVLEHAGLGNNLGNNTPLIFYTRYGFHHKPNVCGASSSWCYKPGGNVVILQNGKFDAKIIADKLGDGHLHGFDLWFDGNKIVFAYAKQPRWPPQRQTAWPEPERRNDSYAHELREIEKMLPLHLYEMNLQTGDITQLTNDSYWSDTEPVYLPDGSIVFSSERSANSPSCDSLNNDLADLNLYVISPDRKTLHRFANHKDIDMHPKLLNDGRVAYLRWEYQERYFMETHSVWTARQDGSGVDALFKQHLPLPYSVRLASSLGDTKKLLAIAAGHHTLPQGALVVLDPSTGISNPNGIKVVTQGINLNEGSVPYPSVEEGGRTDAGGFYTDPYSLDNQSFLVSYAFASPTAKRYSWYNSDADSNGYGIYIVDVFGNKELLYRDPFLGAYNAMPLKERTKPPVLAHTIDRSKNYAVCSIPDVQEGMEEVASGTVKYIRILEALPWKVVQGEGAKRWSPIYTWHDKNATRWCPVRVIGDVPVEKDGSAHFKVPATDGASVYFEALDEHKQEVRRMRSSVSFTAGEIRSCAGCHESNSIAVNTTKNANSLAMRHEPSEPIPPKWGSQTPIHFPRDVQPLLTKNCVSCHSGKDAKKGLDFSENIALRTILDKKLVQRSDTQNNSEISKPYQFGSNVSKLTQAISPFKHDNAKLSSICPFELPPEEYEVLTLWVDANIPYTGEMLHKRTKDGKQNVWLPLNWQNPWLTPINQPTMPK
jgi:hypothetical protein